MKLDSPRLRFAIYARKSSEQDDRQVLSIESQLDELENLKQHEDIQIVQVITDSASAFKANNRTGFKELLALIHSGEIQGVLVWKENRLARNMLEGGQLIHLLQIGKIQQLWTPFCRYDPTSNVLPLTIAFGMANQYSKDLSDTISRGMRAKAKDGGYCSMAPIGFRNNKLEKTVEKDNHYFDKMRQYARIYLTGNYSLADVCRIADMESFRTPKKGKIGGRKLTTSTLHRLFTNPFIAGKVLSGEQWIEGNHPAMISWKDFLRIQELLGRQGRLKFSIQRETFWLRGLLSCGKCGRSITAEKKRKYFCPKCKKACTRKTPHDCPRCGKTISKAIIENGSQYIYYHCTQPKICKQGCSHQHVLQEQIETELQKLKLEEQLKGWAQQWSTYVIDHFDDRFEKEIECLAIKSKQVEKRLQNLLAMRLDDEISAEEYKRQKLQFESELNQIKSEQKEAGLPKDLWRKKVFRSIQEQINLTCRLEEIEVKERKFYLQKIFSNPTLKDGKLSLHAARRYHLLNEARQAANGILEPPETLIDKGQIKDFDRQYPMWSSYVNDHRTDRQTVKKII
jgi:DNA invertase Pin-like site-specific DNA recombinase